MRNSFLETKGDSMRSTRLCLLTTLFCAFATAVVLAADDQVLPTTKSEKLFESMLPKPQWKRAGFSTPQKTAETFMWALRERDAVCIRSCFNDPKKVEAIELQSKESKEVGDAASGLQSLAIRRIDERTVDLKFRVAGWGKKPFSHRFKKVSEAWKIDSSSNTLEANW